MSWTDVFKLIFSFAIAILMLFVKDAVERHLRKRNAQKAMWNLQRHLPRTEEACKAMLDFAELVASGNGDVLNSGIMNVDMGDDLDGELVALDYENAAVYVRVASITAALRRSVERFQAIEADFDRSDQRSRRKLLIACAGFAEEQEELSRTRLQLLRVLRCAASDHTEGTEVIRAAERDVVATEQLLRRIDGIVAATGLRKLALASEQKEKT